MPTTVSISILIDLLFEEITPTYTISHVSEITGISSSQISQIRTGKRTNPTLKTIQSILSFFEIPFAYLDSQSLDEAREIIRRTKIKSTDEEEFIAVVNDVREKFDLGEETDWLLQIAVSDPEKKKKFYLMTRKIYQVLVLRYPSIDIDWLSDITDSLQ